MTAVPQPARAADAPASPFRESRFGWLVLVAVWSAAALYLGLRLRQGWVPPDAGMLAQMADRVLRGQLPHRDFVEVYTGGLTFLNALAFRLFGVNLLSLRIPLFLCFLGWVPSVYFIARRFAAPIAAGAVTLLAVAWSVPNYPEAMASWYNLFFATWGVLALLCFTETRRNRWLWVAGLCAGLSFLVKISSLFFLAATLLFFLFREQALPPAPGPERKRRDLLYRLFVTAGLLLFLAALSTLVFARPSASNFFQFLLPSAALAAFLLWRTWRHPAPAAADRFRRLFAVALPFLAATLLPVLLFLAWYERAGALTAWFHGTFLGPGMHLLWPGWDAFPPLAGLAGLLPALLVVIAAYDARGSSRRLARLVTPLALAALLFWAWRSIGGYLFVGYSVPLVVPLLALAVPYSLRSSAPAAGPQRQQVFLLAAAATLCALVAFPTAATIYFCYVAPLVILAVLALFSSRPGYDRVLLGSLLAFYLVFALWLRVPGYYDAMRSHPHQSVSFRPLALPRAGGIRVDAAEAAQYEALIRLVRAHAAGPFIYCAPDCPQLYFLSAKRNPTPTIWDFLDPDFLDVPARNQRILQTLETRCVNLVVLHHGRLVDSGPLPAALRTALDARYPRSRIIGNFDVRWKP